ncbi:hypothetical protein, partial [Prevotella sp.]|uniref:hypothetical protein n=1 Tax=Prevotella sp. TaxID=59823 RepID=UPI003FD8B8A7
KLVFRTMIPRRKKHNKHYHSKCRMTLLRYQGDFPRGKGGKGMENGGGRHGGALRGNMKIMQGKEEGRKECIKYIPRAERTHFKYVCREEAKLFTFSIKQHIISHLKIS